jgi:para-nitrobenzyl esterase
MSKLHLIAATAALALTAAAATAVHSQPPGPPPAAVPAAPPPALSGEVITTRLGQIQGFASNGVAVFRGLPFAAPPVGDLRWREPAPAKAWTGVRPANAFGGACNQTEDCLYLNVFTKAGAKPAAKMPVILWIHGGGFAGGSGAGTDGSAFVRNGVIVVSVNYRLGRAGWFAHPALDKEPGLHGNYGVMDQIAALKWTRDNIAAFGGDPANVTIAGGSAGAISVNYLMLAPQARGLFAKAISESGFGRMAVLPIAGQSTGKTGPTAEDLGKAFAERNNIKGDDAAAAKALRSLTLAQLQAAAGGVGSPDQPKPLADGKLITGTAEEEFRQNKEARIPYMLGGNSDEASLTRRNTDVAGRFAPVKSDAAFLAVFDPAKSNDADRIVARLITDESISEPNRALARIHAGHGQPTFLYHFSYVPTATRATAFGMGHGGETSYVFATPRAGSTFDAEGQAVANAANAYWAAFAKTGNPGAAGGTAWVPFDAAKEAQIDFTGVSAPVMRERFDAARLNWVEAEVAN